MSDQAPGHVGVSLMIVVRREKVSDGALTGAKVDADASILTGGGGINVPVGTLLETSLRTPLTVDLAT